jgi:hypothetical protein
MCCVACLRRAPSSEAKRLKKGQVNSRQTSDNRSCFPDNLFNQRLTRPLAVILAPSSIDLAAADWPAALVEISVCSLATLNG